MPQSAISNRVIATSPLSVQVNVIAVPRRGCLSKPVEVDVYDRVWEHMTSKAHDPQATRLAINTLLEGLPQ